MYEIKDFIIIIIIIITTNTVFRLTKNMPQRGNFISEDDEKSYGVC